MKNSIYVLLIIFISNYCMGQNNKFSKSLQFGYNGGIQVLKPDGENRGFLKHGFQMDVTLPSTNNNISASLGINFGKEIDFFKNDNYFNSLSLGLNYNINLPSKSNKRIKSIITGLQFTSVRTHITDYKIKSTQLENGLFDIEYQSNMLTASQISLSIPLVYQCNYLVSENLGIVAKIGFEIPVINHYGGCFVGFGFNFGNL